jgi:hypothetical protein
MLIGPLLRPYGAPMEGESRINIRFPTLPLLKGEHFLSVGLFHDDWVNAYDFHDRYYRFTVSQPTEWGIKGEIYVNAEVEYLK